jgi:hypothetical protein
VWEKQVDKTELERYKKDYTMLSNKLVAGRPLIHVYAETRPDETFEIAENTLEDVFFAKINNVI